MKTNSNTEILYEDNHIIIVNKRSGDLVQGDKTGDQSLDEVVKAYIGQKYDKPGRVFLGVVHRVDRPVTGAVIFARTSKALERLNRMLREREIKKTYLTITKEKPPLESGVIKHFLKKNEKQNKSYAYNDEVKGSKAAELTYRLLGRSDKYYLLEIDLHSGRHHQIRCQLSAIGCAIRGDLKYGYPRSNPDGGISLHSYRVSFTHPVTGEAVSVTAPVPKEDLWRNFRELLPK